VFPPTLLNIAPLNADLSEESNDAIVGSGVDGRPAAAASVNTLTLQVNVPEPAQLTLAGGAAAYPAFVVVNWKMPVCAVGFRIVRVLSELFSGRRFSS